MSLSGRVASASPAGRVPIGSPAAQPNTAAKTVSSKKQISGPNTKKLVSKPTNQPHNTGKQSPSENKENKGQGQGVVLREKRTSSVGAPNSAQSRLSSCSLDSTGEAGNRSSAGSIPESWSRALDSFHFVVDTNQDGQAYKQIQRQKNAQDGPEAVRRALSHNAGGSNRPVSHSPNRGRRPSGSSTSRAPKAAPSPPARGSSSSSSSSGLPTPRYSEGSSPSTSSSDSGRMAQVAKKQVPSKIASLWKRDTGTPPGRSSPQSRLPVFTKTPPLSAKPSSLPPSGVRATKAATLPAGLSAKSLSAHDGISKSSTYEKIANTSRMRPSGSTPGSRQGSKGSFIARAQKYQSPETGTRRGEVFELCDDCSDEETHNASLDNVFDTTSVNSRDDTKGRLDSTTSDSADCLDSGNEHTYSIDSSTFKKKKKTSSISELELPNADETIKSMCSFNDSINSPNRANLSANSSMDFSLREDNVKSMTSLDNSLDSSETEKVKRSKKDKSKEGVKTKSKVAQGFKKLFGKNKSDKDKDQSKSKNKFAKEKSHVASVKITRELSEEDKLVLCSQAVNTAPQKATSSQGVNTSKAMGSQRPDYKSSPSAIVAPFNYSPPAHSTSPGVTAGVVTENSSVVIVDSHSVNNRTVTMTTECSDENVELGDDSLLNGEDKPLTKTEMLMARRRKSNLNSTSSDKGDMGPGCIVTTV